MQRPRWAPSDMVWRRRHEPTVSLLKLQKPSLLSFEHSLLYQRKTPA